ncbi:DUF4982 domain-containing protein [bacterium]|nr:DUF4982 domain-containing protein [bacterium]
MRFRSDVMILVCLAIFSGTGLLSGQEFLQYRNQERLRNWTFYPGDIQSAESGDVISPEGWEDVIVPHTWNAEDVLTEGIHYRQGIGWYRTAFKTPTDETHRRAFIRFSGVSLVADVFLNGTYLGKHRGGYSAFCFEMTPYLRTGEMNILAVKVDNSMQPDVAPSGTYLYPLFGGIYRPVTVFTTPDICISPLDDASSGIYIHPLTVTKDRADIEVVTLIDYQKCPVLQTTSIELKPTKEKKGQGLLGTYYANPDFEGPPVHTRLDQGIAFQYGSGGPFEDMPGDGFSMIWNGRFVPAKTGIYRFVLNSDDGSRLFLGGEKIIDHWGNHAAYEKWGEAKLREGHALPIEIRYYESGGDASIRFGWQYVEENPLPVQLQQIITLMNLEGMPVVSEIREIKIIPNELIKFRQKIHMPSPHLWDARRDPKLYTLQVRLEDSEGTVIDAVNQPLGLRYFQVDPDGGLILNGQPYSLYGVCRHQEWEGLGPALTGKHHEKDVEYILELGANGVRLAHYQQADTMYSLCDAHGLVVWAEIPNTPVWRAECAAYLDNCRDQLTELIKQNYNHPSILIWGLYNEIPISKEAIQSLHETAKQIDPYRLTTQADYTQVTDRHFVTDVAAWNWYFGWYYGQFDQYPDWFDEMHQNHPGLKGGLSEYGAGGCISQQQDPPERPDPTNGCFFPEQYQRYYHEEAWKRIKDRQDIWCKFIWNMFDFSWTGVDRGDRPYINHKGLMTHDRKVKKDAFYFYKANWSDEPVLYLLDRRYTERTGDRVSVAVYTNLDEVTLFVNEKQISGKKMESEIHKIIWEDVRLRKGLNSIRVVGKRGDQVYSDSCEWNYTEQGKE